MTTPSPPSGWYPDPSGAPGQRYFDGTQWTEHRSGVPARFGLSREERADRLDAAIAECIRYGGRVESHAQNQATVAYGREPNHVLWALLSIFTCGIGLIGWVIDASTNRVTRVTLRVDPHGNVTRV